MTWKERWRTADPGERVKWVLLGLSGLITLEGVVALAFLMFEPSQTGGAGFLGYSTERWALIFVNGLPVILLVLFAWGLWTGRSWAKRLASWLTDQRVQRVSLILVTLFFVGALVASTWGLRYLRLSGQSYYGRLRPSLIWAALVSGQVWLVLTTNLWYEIITFFRLQFPFNETPQVFPNLRDRSQAWLYGGLALVYSLLQLVSYLNVRSALHVPDSIDYIFPAQNLSIWSLDFWGYKKAAFVAAFYKLGNGSLTWIDGAQMLVSALVWLILAWVFARSVQTRGLKPVAFGLILAFSLVPAVQVWNHVALSESLSLSMMILILALWLALVQRWHWSLFFGLLLLLSAWLFTRESNAYLGLLMAIMLFFVGLIWRNQRFYWFFVVILTALFFFNSRLAEMPDLPRWSYPLGNVILGRVLPEPDYLEFFVQAKMPVNPELLALSGGNSHSGELAIFNDVALNDFEEWLFARGKQAYFDFMLTHPGYTLFGPLRALPALLAASVIEYAPPSYRPALPEIINELLYPIRWFWLYLTSSGLIVAIGIWLKVWRERRVFWVIAACLALAIPHIYLSWLGDSVELGRHAVQASVQFRLAIWLLFLIILDTIWIAKREGPPSEKKLS
jgi:hypothetical protein